MNKPLKSDTPKAEMKINVQGYKVTLCFAERPNLEAAAFVKQSLLSSYAMLQNRSGCKAHFSPKTDEFPGNSGRCVR